MHGSERGFPLSVPRSVGLMGAARHHSRLGKRSKFCGDERFFYLGPSLLDPTLHSLRIALPGSLGWSLQCPVHRSEYFPHMSRVIVPVGQALDNNRYARQGPQICAKTVGPRSLSQCDLDTLQLLSFQLRSAACSARASQCAATAP